MVQTLALLIEIAGFLTLCILLTGVLFWMLLVLYLTLQAIFDLIADHKNRKK